MQIWSSPSESSPRRRLAISRAAAAVPRKRSVSTACLREIAYCSISSLLIGAGVSRFFTAFLNTRFCQAGSAATILSVISFERAVTGEAPDTLDRSRTATLLLEIMSWYSPGLVKHTHSLRLSLMVQGFELRYPKLVKPPPPQLRVSNGSTAPCVGEIVKCS